MYNKKKLFIILVVSINKSAGRIEVFHRRLLLLKLALNDLLLIRQIGRLGSELSGRLMLIKSDAVVEIVNGHGRSDCGGGRRLDGIGGSGRVGRDYVGD